MSRFSADKSTVRIVFVEGDGTERPVDAPVAASLMRTAKVEGVRMYARCGAGLKCATCHVSIPEEFRAVVGDPDTRETETLERAVGVTCLSRLSCQVIVRKEMEGMRVRIMPMPPEEAERAPW